MLLFFSFHFVLLMFAAVFVVIVFVVIVAVAVVGGGVVCCLSKVFILSGLKSFYSQAISNETTHVDCNVC